MKRQYVTPSSAQKLKEFAENIDKLETDNKKLKQQLEEEKERSALAEKYASPSRHLSNGPDQTQYIEDIKSKYLSVNVFKRFLMYCSNCYRYVLLQCILYVKTSITIFPQVKLSET